MWDKFPNTEVKDSGYQHRYFVELLYTFLFSILKREQKERNKQKKSHTKTEHSTVSQNLKVPGLQLIFKTDSNI